jgi:hypothetical protein
MVSMKIGRSIPLFIFYFFQMLRPSGGNVRQDKLPSVETSEDQNKQKTYFAQLIEKICITGRKRKWVSC